MISTRRVTLIAVAALAAGLPLCLAQTEDDQTRDWEEQDRRYQQRLSRQEEAEKLEAAAPDGASEREAFLARAEKMIRDSKYRSTMSDHYRIQTDAPDVDVRAAAMVLEAFRAYFDDSWSGRLELADYDETSRVFLFWSFKKFNDLLSGDWRYSSVRPKGHYTLEYDLITLHTDPGDPGALAGSLVHEAAHQLIEQRIYRGGPSSFWISEGLASYYGYTAMGRDGFETGTIGGKSISVIKGAKPGAPVEAKARLSDLRQAIKSASREDYRPLVDVVRIRDPSVFYGPGAQRYYSASWALVHFLLHGEEGEYADEFLRYIEREVAGEGGADPFFEAIGLDETQLETLLVAHVRKMKAR